MGHKVHGGFSVECHRAHSEHDPQRAYAEAVEGAFGMDVNYARVIKLYGAPADNPDSRYSPAPCIVRRTGDSQRLVNAYGHC